MEKLLAYAHPRNWSECFPGLWNGVLSWNKYVYRVLWTIRMTSLGAQRFGVPTSQFVVNEIREFATAQRLLKATSPGDPLRWVCVDVHAHDIYAFDCNEYLHLDPHGQVLGLSLWVACPIFVYRFFVFPVLSITKKNHDLSRQGVIMHMHCRNFAYISSPPIVPRHLSLRLSEQSVVSCGFFGQCVRLHARLLSAVAPIRIRRPHRSSGSSENRHGRRNHRIIVLGASNTGQKRCNYNKQVRSVHLKLSQTVARISHVLVPLHDLWRWGCNYQTRGLRFKCQKVLKMIERDFVWTCVCVV